MVFLGIFGETELMLTNLLDHVVEGGHQLRRGVLEELVSETPLDLQGRGHRGSANNGDEK